MADTPPLLQRMFPCFSGTPVDRRNQGRFMVLAIAFAASWAGANLLIVDGTIPAGLPARAAVCVPGALGLALVWAFTRFVRQTDELRRRVQLEAMAWGFAAGLVWTVLRSLARRAGFDGIDGGAVAVTMVCAYSIGVFVLTARFDAMP